MKTAYINGIFDYGVAYYFKDNDPYFVIGVKDNRTDLDTFLAKYPQLEIVKRFPEIYNGNYCWGHKESTRNNHILQPALLKLKDKV